MTVNRTNKVVYLGLMVGIAMGLHIFESLIPIPTPVPGASLGSPILQRCMLLSVLL